MKRNIFFGTIYKFGSRCWKKLYQHRKEWSYNLNYFFISLHFSHCKKLLPFPSYFHFFHFLSFLHALNVAQLSPHQICTFPYFIFIPIISTCCALIVAQLSMHHADTQQGPSICGKKFSWEKKPKLYIKKTTFFIKKEKRSATCRNDLKQAVKGLFIREKIPMKKKPKLCIEKTIFF